MTGKQGIHPTCAVILASASLALVAACARDNPSPTTVHTANSVSAQQSTDVYPEEVPFWHLAQEVPSSAGFYRDSLTGDLIVLVTNPKEAEAAKAALRGSQAQRLAKEHLRNPHADVVVRPAKFTFLQLKAWRDAMSEAMGFPNVEWLDLDEVRNLVVLGVDSGTDREPIRQLARRLGVPQDAIDIVQSEPVKYRRSLTDSIRPIVGGIRLQYDSVHVAVFECTLGFPALWNGMKAFVTASHCSANIFQVDGVYQYQPKWPITHADSQNILPIGFEVADFSPSLAICPSNLRGNVAGCLWADAAVYQFIEGDANWALGGVARPGSGCFTGGCTPVDLSYANTSVITATKDTPVVNDVVNKIGEATGWTEAFVSQSCVMKKGEDKAFVLLCQDVTNFGNGDGDSGAPVLMNINPLPDTTATLAGIFWGGTNREADFSPWSGILKEYQGLTAH